MVYSDDYDLSDETIRIQNSFENYDEKTAEN